jgi:hypothetical protein
MRLLTREEQCGINRGPIDQMLRGREVFVHEGLMDHLGTTGFVDGRRGRVHMRQQMRVGGSQVSLTCTIEPVQEVPCLWR